MASLEAIVERAHQLGLCLCIENMFPRSHWLVDPEEFQEVLNCFPTLNLTLDTGHAFIGERSERKILRFVETFADRIGHVHANDNLGREDDHLPIGAGRIDFNKVVKGLKEAGYNDTITLEVFSKDKEYVKISRDRIAALFTSQ